MNSLNLDLSGHRTRETSCGVLLVKTLICLGFRVSASTSLLEVDSGVRTVEKIRLSLVRDEVTFFLWPHPSSMTISILETLHLLVLLNCLVEMRLAIEARRLVVRGILTSVWTNRKRRAIFVSDSAQSGHLARLLFNRELH